MDARDLYVRIQKENVRRFKEALNKYTLTEEEEYLLKHFEEQAVFDFRDIGAVISRGA